MPLTESWLKAKLNKPIGKIEEHSDRDSLSVRVTVKGRITFQLRYRYDSKACRVDIGSYPLIGLKEARIKCLEYRALLEQGIDPRSFKKESKPVCLTVNNLFDLWYEKYCSVNKNNHAEIKRTFEMYVFNIVGSEFVDSVSVNQWFNLIDNISKDVPSIANRVLINMKQCIAWGYKRELVQFNALKDLKAKMDFRIQTNVKERVLSDLELKLIFEGCDKTKMSYKNKIFLKILLIYGCRVGELKQAKKQDFDLINNTWTIPVNNHKAGKHTKKALIRPITDNIKPYIEKAMVINNSDYLFTHVRDENPVAKKGHTSLPRVISIWLNKNNTPIATWSIHDLRRTARTNFSALTEPHIAEIMLGHTLPKIWRTYDKHDYLKEQGKAYSLWVVKLESIWGKM